VSEQCESITRVIAKSCARKYRIVCSCGDSCSRALHLADKPNGAPAFVPSQLIGTPSAGTPPHLKPSIACVRTGYCVPPREMTIQEVLIEAAILDTIVVTAIFAPEVLPALASFMTRKINPEIIDVSDTEG
jgi:hypothetical protein